ncbi:DNA-3-methyladenine glycosylase I [Marisediminicola antarctica]|uniref:3-methyladenine DNA glycosylase n=1 Tax=Marisediminicola antarctica TaxID=674079 RepID=A0A7L5AGJ8_9MICO|nr:DNA-3-methyladenine glycosylase I [Marisediminicola antarctica]QHO69658.1 3-methyladenine DNA glycosylase [Marisediminicola antarctica]
MSVVADESGTARCAWSADDAEYRRYHDEEWGFPLHGDRPLFEKLSLEGFQAGLSWITILRRRPTFRRAFSDFEIDAVAALTTSDIERLMLDSGIIRNRAKIEATISNARITLELVRDDPGALDRILWSFAPDPRARPPQTGEVPAVTAESTAMSTALRRLGYRFVGPTTLYALMQSSGMVDDHVEGCWRASR